MAFPAPCASISYPEITYGSVALPFPGQPSPNAIVANSVSLFILITPWGVFPRASLTFIVVSLSLFATLPTNIELKSSKTSNSTTKIFHPIYNTHVIIVDICFVYLRNS